MGNRAQRHVDQLLGRGQGNRADYSNHRISRPIPATLQEWDDLRRAAHDAGPGSSLYSDYMALLQAGYDRDNMPDASGGGIPRNINETQAALNDAAEDAREYFKPELVHPMLHEYGIPQLGKTFAELGPDYARAVVTEMMATSTSREQRAALVELHKAIEASPTSSLGVVIEAPDERLEFSISMGDDNGPDPSGFTQWREGQAGLAPGVEGLMLQARMSDATYDGISNTGGGGGTYDHYTARQMAAVRAGDLGSLALDTQGMQADFHQGDEVADPISSY